MGGNAVKNVRRIKRDEIPATLAFISSRLEDLGLTYTYLSTHMMGSAGKQNDSGDLDIAVDELQFSKDLLREILIRVKNEFGLHAADSRTLKGGQIQTAWPIQSCEGGNVQVDFILGDPQWLKFSHHSPGLDVSPYKGVWISTMLGVVAKYHKDYELFRDPHSGMITLSDLGMENRIARVGLSFDLEKGLFRKWGLQKRQNQGLSNVDPDYWETHVPLLDGQRLPPRFQRIGYVTNPTVVLEMLLGPTVQFNQIDTFEKLWSVVKNCNLAPEQDVADRFAEALVRSSSGKDFKDKDQILKEEVFK